MAALDDNIVEYIKQSFTPYKSDMIVNITDTIEKLNQVPNIDVYYNFPYVNSFLIDLITEDSVEVDLEDKKIEIELNLRKTFIHYIESFGIMLDESKMQVMGLVFFNELVTSLLTIFTLDIKSIDAIIGMLDNQDDVNTITMANILAEHCNLSGIEIYYNLEDISDESMENLRSSLEQVISNNESTLVEENTEMNKLIEHDEIYSYTKVYDRYLNGDRPLQSFSTEINFLYNVINSYKTIEEVMMYGVYEVLCLLYITTEEKDVYKETLDSCLNLEYIKLIGEDQKLQDQFNINLNNLLEDLGRVK